MAESGKISRRAFLARAAAVGIAAPMLGTLPSRRVSANEMINHVSFGGGGYGWSDVRELRSHPHFRLHAIVDVDENRARSMREAFPDAKFFRDWRELFDQEAGHFESCNIGTPDHMHGPIGLRALAEGKHVYCQKPLCHNLYETRRLTEAAAARPELVTQMGIQIHSRGQYRQAVQAIRQGVIGKVHTVHTWSDKTWGRNEPVPGGADSVPSNLDWDLWLGVAPERPYLEGMYHPDEWRRIQDFGCGTFGDMAPHIYDPVFKALDLGMPTQVMSVGPEPAEGVWPRESEVRYKFPATDYTHEDGVHVTWYDGDRQIAEEARQDIDDGTNLPEQGSVFIGSEGSMLLPHVDWPRLFPRERLGDVELPEAGHLDHRHQYLDAIRGEGETLAPFSYAGPLTEAILAGTIAVRFPNQELGWDGVNMKFHNEPRANQYVVREYRDGWVPAF